jgi:eukaryotic-like serine/threonine-protein kinase
MEYVDGCNLKALSDRLKQRGRRIELPQAIYLMVEACKGLSYAHHTDNPESNEPLKIVHRDISPPNILLSKMGEVKLVDFGLAKANSQIESTDPGVVKGKFSYLSPEAASGREVDHRADIFAIGILLWEMFTGRRLFYGDTDYQTVELVRQARIPSVAALNPDVDPELEAVVRKSLARDPNDRYQEAADLGDALSQYLFSRRMKVTARDIAALVRDVQIEQARRRSLAPQESIIDVLIQEEMAKVTSLIDGDHPDGAVGQTSLDPSSFVDTSGWAADFGFAAEPAPAPAPAPPPPVPAVRSSIRQVPRVPTPLAHDEEIESLQQMLEPDRTGVHDTRDTRLVVAVLVLVFLVAVLGTGLILYRDQIFG